MDENKLHQYARSETAHPMKENGNGCQPFESPFRSWLNAVGVSRGSPGGLPETTLEQLVAFAKQIQEEVNGSERTDCSVEAVVARVRQTPLDQELAVWKGIRASWLRAVFFETPIARRWKELGCEMWFLRKVGIIEMLRHCSIEAGTWIEHVGIMFNLPEDV